MIIPGSFSVKNAKQPGFSVEPETVKQPGFSVEPPFSVLAYIQKKNPIRKDRILGVRWARLELAQDYSHYPLKVACLPFHHHRFVLGLQRYDKYFKLQIFLQYFLKNFQFSFGGLSWDGPFCIDFQFFRYFIGSLGKFS